MSSTVYPLGRVPHPETPRAASLYPVTEHPDYKVSSRTYRWWWEGGAWLDQGSYGTCVGNAFAHRRADSPVPEGGIDEYYAQKLYLEANGDDREPSQVPSSDPIWDQGASALSACRVLARRGTIRTYYWVTSMSDLRNTVLDVGSVCIGINWYRSMDNPVSRYSNSYIVLNELSGLRGGHEVLINGIQLRPTYGKPFVRIKNSWGRGWGHRGTARMFLDDLEHLIFGQGGDAVVITENP